MLNWHHSRQGHGSGRSFAPSRHTGGSAPTAQSASPGIYRFGSKAGFSISALCRDGRVWRFPAHDHLQEVGIVNDGDERFALPVEGKRLFDQPLLALEIRKQRPSRAVVLRKRSTHT